MRYLFFTIQFFTFFWAAAQQGDDYREYHHRIIRAELLITEEKFDSALLVMDSVFHDYGYVFLRDLKVGAQLAFYLGDHQKSLNYLKAGIANGWTLSEIEGHLLLNPLKQDPGWNAIIKEYHGLRSVFLRKLNSRLAKAIKKMFLVDQKLARMNLSLADENMQEEFLLKQFVPVSERHMFRIREMLESQGYPGEKLTGDRLWTWTILSHHNSISPFYNKNDTIYRSIRPLLLDAIRSGELSPYDFAIIEEWQILMISDHREKSYGYIGTLSTEDVSRSNQMRQDIGMRSIEVTNKLVDIQEKTGIDFCLEGGMWISGKIPVK